MNGRWRDRLSRRLVSGVVRALVFMLGMPVRLVPPVVRRGVCFVVFRATAQERPESALRTLFRIETDLTRHMDEAAIRYDGGIHAKHRLMRYHEFFVERVRPGERVLDLGCGHGAVAYSMASRGGAIVTGVDVSEISIAEARRRFEHPKLRFVQQDFLVGLPSEECDTIVMSNVLEHIEQRVEFLRSVQERLKPRRWLIRVPMSNRDWRVPLRRELGVRHFSDDTHFVEYTEEEFVSEMRSAGLGVLAMRINWGEIWAEVSAGALRGGEGKYPGEGGPQGARSTAG